MYKQVLLLSFTECFCFYLLVLLLPIPHQSAVNALLQGTLAALKYAVTTVALLYYCCWYYHKLQLLPLLTGTGTTATAATLELATGTAAGLDCFCSCY